MRRTGADPEEKKRKWQKRADTDRCARPESVCRGLYSMGVRQAVWRQRLWAEKDMRIVSAGIPDYLDAVPTARFCPRPGWKQPRPCPVRLAARIPAGRGAVIRGAGLPSGVCPIDSGAATMASRDPRLLSAWQRLSSEGPARPKHNSQACTRRATRGARG